MAFSGGDCLKLQKLVVIGVQRGVGEVCSKKDIHVLTCVAWRQVEVSQRRELPGSLADLFADLTAGAFFGRLAVFQYASRQLEQHLLRAQAVLAHKPDVAILVERHDGDGDRCGLRDHKW